LQKALILFIAAEAHDMLDAGAVVPAAIKDHDLAGGRKMPEVALDIQLALFPVGRRRQRHDPEGARADALGDALDDAALAGSIAPLEHDNNSQSLFLDPVLQLYQLALQPFQFGFIVLL